MDIKLEHLGGAPRWQHVCWVAIGKSLTFSEPPFSCLSTRATVGNSEHLRGRVFGLSNSCYSAAAQCVHHASDSGHRENAVSFFLSSADSCRRPRSTTTRIEGDPVRTCIALEPAYRERGEDVGLLRVLSPTIKPLELSPRFHFVFFPGCNTGRRKALSSPQTVLKALPEGATCSGKKVGNVEQVEGEAEEPHAAGWLLWPA